MPTLTPEQRARGKAERAKTKEQRMKINADFERLWDNWIKQHADGKAGEPRKYEMIGGKK